MLPKVRGSNRNPLVKHTNFKTSFFFSPVFRRAQLESVSYVSKFDRSWRAVGMPKPMRHKHQSKYWGREERTPLTTLFV